MNNVNLYTNKFHQNDVVQFLECHKWCGCLGIVDEIKNSSILVGVPMPERGIAYIRCSKDEIELVGQSIFTISD